MTSPAATAPHVPTWLTLLLATACGLIVANLYYAQPLVGPISTALGMAPDTAALIVTLTQIGYGAGLLLLVPLADLLENRRLVLVLLMVQMVALVFSSTASHGIAFLGLSLLIGFSAVAVQVLVPYAAHLAPEAERGRVVGNVMSGLMLGIMLARPLSSTVTHLWSWHAVYGLSAALMAALAIVLRLILPARQPSAQIRYGALLASMGKIVADYPVLRRRALYQACMFGAFSLFWTVAPLWLASPAFGLTQKGIALFALAGVAGAIASPIAGRVADQGLSHGATIIFMGLGAASFGLTFIAPPGSTLALGLVTAAAILLDFGVSGNLVLGQRAVYGLSAPLRGRLNGLYIATFFCGGAAGSALGGWSFAHWGWNATAGIGMAMPILGLLYFATERRLRTVSG